MLSGEVAAADIVPADARTTSRDQSIRIFFMIAISPRLRANTVGATALQRGGLCSTGVHENSPMQPDRIQVAWSVLVQLCFLDLGTGVPILQGDLTSGLKGKRANRLLRATGSLFPASLSCFAGQGCRSTTQPVVSPYKVMDKILSCGRGARATNSAFGQLFGSRSRRNGPAARKIFQQIHSLLGIEHRWMLAHREILNRHCPALVQ